MLVRTNRDGATALIHQEQHALVSGILATAWRPALDPRLISAILLHDNPWRGTDHSVRRDADGQPVDFVKFPAAERLTFYSEGLDSLEAVDPYIAHLVSLHYSSFAGIDDESKFAVGERERRERLEPLVAHRGTLDQDLRWLQFFDVASLWLCLTGPDVDDTTLPAWLRAPKAFAQPPDAVVRTWEWTAQNTATITPWPFDDAHMSVDVYFSSDGESHVRHITLQDSAQSTTS